MAQNPLLSLCMIVKDEEDSIERCLAGVQHVADELIIVDTGSGDRTKELCRRFTANIIDYPWSGSFAAARNVGLEKATGHFILWLDADEVLEVPDTARFRQTLEDTEQDILPLPLVNFMGSKPDENNAYLFTGYRIFRAAFQLRFAGRIHERLDLSGFSGKIANSPLPARILHYGYMDGAAAAKKKSARNLEMLEKERNSAECSPWTKYHLASEYYRQKDYPKAFDCVNAAIGDFLGLRQLPPSLVYKLKYDILLTGGCYEEAWPGIEKAISLYPDYADLHFYRGLILLAQKQYEKAAHTFCRCVMLGDGGTGYLTLKGVGSFHALYYLGVCYENMGRIPDAQEAYSQALAINPDYGEAEQRLKNLVHKSSKEASPNGR